MSFDGIVTKAIVDDIKEKLKNKYKIIEFTSLNDAYKN